MTAHLDPLAVQERLRKPFLSAVALHVFFFSLTFFYSWALMKSPIRFGDPNAMMGGVVPLNIVRNIPLAPAQTVIQNPVASDTRSSVPPPPPGKAQAQPQEKVEAEAEAIPIPGPKVNKPSERKPAIRRFRPYVPDRDNQLYSVTGMGVNTPSYSGIQPERFGVGIGAGPGNPFGSRYGWYAEALQRRIGEQWQKELAQVDPRVRTGPRTVVFFEILRDGSLRNVRLTQSSGNPSLDYAALRAVTNASPLPQLPSDLGRSSVTTEVWFQLKR
ncbi:MAG: TonB family protein [Acidobacteria bacterium]|nr:TonB family protein [Acidobacteriota bacterium]